MLHCVNIGVYVINHNVMSACEQKKVETFASCAYYSFNGFFLRKWWVCGICDIVKRVNRYKGVKLACDDGKYVLPLLF